MLSAKILTAADRRSARALADQYSAVAASQGEQGDIASDRRLDAGAQDLDRHRCVAGGNREVDLGERGGGDRRVVEFGEHIG